MSLAENEDWNFAFCTCESLQIIAIFLFHVWIWCSLSTISQTLHGNQQCAANQRKSKVCVWWFMNITFDYYKHWNRENRRENLHHIYTSYMKITGLMVKETSIFSLIHSLFCDGVSIPLLLSFHHLSIVLSLSFIYIIHVATTSNTNTPFLNVYLDHIQTYR